MKRWVDEAMAPWNAPIPFILKTMMTHSGMQIMSGPFKGMKYIGTAVGSVMLPKLVGVYERELHGVVEKACAARPELIVDIGAAEGYYAVGMALRNPQAKVIAFEMNPKGREAIKALAELNGVAGRVEIREKCEATDMLAVLRGARRAMVIVDVEGYELDLFTPEVVEALGSTSVLMETHDILVKGCREGIVERMKGTHEIVEMLTEEREVKEMPCPTWRVRMVSREVRWRLISEGRGGPMTFLWMTPKAK